MNFTLSWRGDGHFVKADAIYTPISHFDFLTSKAEVILIGVRGSQEPVVLTRFIHESSFIIVIMIPGHLAATCHPSWIYVFWKASRNATCI